MSSLEDDLAGCLGGIAGYLLVYGGLAALGVGIIGFFIQSLFLSLVVWGPPVLLLFVLIRLFINNKVFKLQAGGKLAGTLPVEFDEKKLRWSVAEKRADPFSGNLKPVWMAAGLTSILLIVIPTGLYFSPDFSYPGYVWFLGTIQVSQLGTFVLYSILSQLILGTVIGVNLEDLEDSLTRRTKSMIVDMNEKLEGTRELRNLESHVDSLYSELEVDCPVNYRRKVAEAAKGKRTMGETDPAKLNNLVGEKVRQARREVDKLEKAINLREEVEKTYEKAAHEVRKTGSIPLIKELEDDYQGLDSPQTDKLIRQKSWEDYYEVLDLLKEDLQDLTEVAQKYQQEGFEKRQASGGKNTQSQQGEMTEELAYRILGLQKEATAEEIKKKKRKLSKAYHPDHNKEVADDTMLKRINVACDFLEEKRGF